VVMTSSHMDIVGSFDSVVEDLSQFVELDGNMQVGLALG
jgi:hypothetical protein